MLNKVQSPRRNLYAPVGIKIILLLLPFVNVFICKILRIVLQYAKKQGGIGMSTDSITKQKLTEQQIEKMTEKAFYEDLKEYKELWEGFFNSAYLVTTESGREAVLKAAPPAEVKLLRYEKDIMIAETTAMKIALGKGIPAPEVLYCDFSRTVCPSRYFFMKKLKGASVESQKDSLDKVQLALIQREAGEINARLNAITGEKFGSLFDRERQYDSWYDAFGSLLSDVLDDGSDIGADTDVDKAEIMAALQRDKAAFDEVTTPLLVHWDIWDGNIFTENGKITGIIDFERAMYADRLMENGFRWQCENDNFLTGYGIDRLSDSEEQRVLWYDLYLALVMVTEHFFRGYSDASLHDWAKGKLEYTRRLLK